MYYYLKVWDGCDWSGKGYLKKENALETFDKRAICVLFQVNADIDDEDVPEGSVSYAAMKLHGLRVLRFYNWHDSCYVNGKILWVPETGKFRSYEDAGGIKDQYKDFDTLQEAEQNLLDKGYTLEWTDEDYMRELGM